MPNLNISVPHRLPRDEALKRVKNAFDQIKVDYCSVIDGLTEQWDGQIGEFNAQVMGLPFSATLWVNGSEVNISGKYPLAGIIYKGRIESEIRLAGERILA